MSKDKVGLEDALLEVMKKRASVSPNRGFCRQLRLLQEECDCQLANYRPEMLQVEIPVKKTQGKVLLLAHAGPFLVVLVLQNQTISCPEE